jgi:hypothetical protein
VRLKGLSKLIYLYPQNLALNSSTSGDRSVAIVCLRTKGNGRMVSCGLLRRVALVRTDVSEDPGASFIRVTKSVN